MLLLSLLKQAVFNLSQTAASGRPAEVLRAEATARIGQFFPD
jgi:hypothetical protein